MLNDSQIRQEITRSEEEHRRLKTSIENAERDARRSSQKIQAAKTDIETAERNLEKQKKDLERVLVEFKYSDEKLEEYKRKDAEYEKKIKTLERDLRIILEKIENDRMRK